MAAFFSGSSSQGVVIPNLYLNDTNNGFCPDSLQSNVMFMNYSTTTTNPESLASHSQSPQNYTEFPVAGATLSQHSPAETLRAGFFSNSLASHLGNNASSAWRDGKMSTLPRSTTTESMGEHVSSGDGLVRNAVRAKTDLSMQMQLGILQDGQNLKLQQPDVSAVQGQGLSLSLGTQVPFKYHKGNPDVSFIESQNSNFENCPHKIQTLIFEPADAFAGDNDIIKDGFLNNFQPTTLMKPMHMNPPPYHLSSLSNTIPSSEYLKAAQELLDEVVNVRDALKPETKRNQSIWSSAGTTGSKEVETGTGASEYRTSVDVAQESTATPSSGFSPAERQELQIRLTQLLSMLDEVDRRYKQYHHQMQIVVTSFDVIAGCGAAKIYTALALQTISRNFRCLRDAISGQLLSTRKCLGEEDVVNAKNSNISRLRVVDQQLRQQRALQQLGMIQQHAWRPQRGLPESSVTILRAWLFEHFLHPYPKDSDKLMLARQTGLSRSQVSNWFINARVRLWKPMVEEMHKEEIGETELDSISSSECVAKEGHSTHDSQERELQGNRNITAGNNRTCQNNSSKSDSVPDGEIPRTCEFGNSSHDNSIYGGDRYISFEMAGMERFGNDNYAAKMHANAGVSLTLGLQHCDGGGLSVPSERQSFMTMGGEDL